MIKDMKRKAAKCISGLALLSVLLSGCGSSVKIPDMSSMGEITVVSRENGSGTKAEFENLTGTDALGTDKIAESTDAVIDMVVGDTDAIGYVAFSSISDTSGAKILKVEGVYPDADSINKGSYKLRRNYGLVHVGETSEVADDFLRYVKTEGQRIVEGYCVAVSQPSTFLSDKPAGTLTIHGSTSAAPIIKKLAKAYMKINTGAKIEVTVSDSTQGINDTLQGKCDLGMVSRSLQSYEKELLTEDVFGRDAIAIVVGQSNPLDDISVDILKKIYDKEYVKWTDIK